jgi:hypothetical protein
MREATRSYVAGVTDAEGCLSINKSNDPRGPIYSARVTVSNRYLQLIKFFIQHFGGYYSTDLPEKKTHNVNYSWHLSSAEHTTKFLSQIYPHLKVKKSQADVLFEYLAMDGENNPAKRELLYQKSSELKNEVRVTTETPTSSKLDLTYLAGFFDGEGHVSIISFIGHGHRQYAARIHVTNTDLPSLEHYKSIYGGSIRPHGKPKKQSYRWELTINEDRMKFLLSMLPYLTVKKEEANIVLQFLRLGSEQSPRKRSDLHTQLEKIKAERVIQSHLLGDKQRVPAETPST